MRWNKARDSFLAAAVALALSGSTGQAMPTGGVVDTGSVAGLVGGTVANGGTLTVNAPSVINWNDFSIASGETLHFDLNASVLNRVTGGNISEIMGNLMAKEHPHTWDNPSFLLVNPNGIVVGNGAQINVPNLTLSTLAISNEDFLANRNNFVTPSDRSIAAPVRITGRETKVWAEKGVDRGLFNDPAYLGRLQIYGGTVEIADGVTVGAAKSLGIHALASRHDDVFEATPENRLNLERANIKNSSWMRTDGEEGILFAGSIKADRSSLAFNGRSGDSNALIAANRWDCTAPENVLTATPENIIEMDGTAINSGVDTATRLALLGGKIRQNNSYVTNADDSSDEQELILAAGNRIVWNKDANSLKEVTATPENNITITGSHQSGLSQLGNTVEAPSVVVAAGSVDFNDTKMQVGRYGDQDLGFFRILAGNHINVGVNEVEATKDNLLHIGKTWLLLPKTMLSAYAGAIRLENDTRITAENGIYLQAMQQSGANWVSQPDNLLSLGNTSLEAKGEQSAWPTQITLLAGTVDLGSAKVEIKEGRQVIVSASPGTNAAAASEEYNIYKGTAQLPADTIYHGNEKAGTLNPVPTPTPTPTPTPGPTPTPEPTPTPTPEPKPTDVVPPTTENIYEKSGWIAMNQILKNDASAESVVKAVDWLKKSDEVTTEQKNDMLVGFLQSINGSALEEADKATLQQTVVKAYEPTEAASAEVDRAVPAEMKQIEQFTSMVTQPEVEQVTETVAEPVTGV